MPNENRLHRIESLIQEELAKIIEVEYEDLHKTLTTITGVNVSADLSFAKIYIVTHHEKGAKEIVKFLNSEQKFLRHELASQIKLRKTPELHFYYDDSIATGERIEQLLEHNKTK